MNTAPQQDTSVYHFDFYRIEAVEEVFDIGYEEYMYSGDYCFMEWPEHVEAILPENTVRIVLSVGDNGQETFIYHNELPFPFLTIRMNYVILDDPK